ncbi:MAG: protein kinase, partial [Myxococcota bacterium]
VHQIVHACMLGSRAAATRLGCRTRVIAIAVIIAIIIAIGREASAAVKCDRCGQDNELGARFCSACGAELAINLVGEVLGGRYRVLSFVGSGGMGRVYRAEHTVLERPVAVKVLAPEYARDQFMWNRFHREALAAGRIAHPHIAATLDFGQEDSLVYSVMEYVDGLPLDTVEMPLELLRALEITRQIAQALGAAHEAGVVHRDVKPGNVIVCELGGRDFIKVVDFGLAVLRIGQNNKPITGPGLTMGTPAYVSPEQVLGEPIDARTDIYALGAVLYEMLVGQPPFGYGDAATLSVSHAYKLPARPNSHPHLSDIPDEVDDFVMRMLAKDPAMRPADGVEVAVALTELLGQISNQVPALTQAERAICVIRFEHVEHIDEGAHRDVIDTVTLMGGRLARSAGDEFIGVFDSATGAVAAAARLAAGPGRSPAAAVHHGRVDLGAGGGVFGRVVNVALRMARLAAPGEALASEVVRSHLDDTLRGSLIDGGRLRLGDHADALDLFRVTGFSSHSTTDHPPVVIAEVRGKSTVAFACSCGFQGVLVVGRLHPGKAVRVRCNSCGRQLSVVPMAGASLAELSARAARPDAQAGDDHLDTRTTDKFPAVAARIAESRDQLIVDPPPDSLPIGESSD